jgi:2-amino-4-hydroxy-6-hydroxymethyldihydropteridine diphosphokinase
MVEVFIALGSNLGDRAANLRRAGERLSAFMVLYGRSSVYETAPQYLEDQPDFLNMVVSGDTDLPAAALLNALKALEKDMGRAPSQRFGPRLIDLDILYYGDQVIETPDLVVPHPRMAQRLFVLQPLCEIAPDKRHPVSGRTAREMLEAITGYQSS